MQDDTLEAVRALDPTLSLSPYSELAVSALTVGFETVFDAPLPQIAAQAVTAVATDLVSSAASTALQSISDVPIVGTIVSFLGGVIGDIAGQAERRKAHTDAQRQECLEVERRLRPIGTGVGGAIVPADLLARYWSLDGRRVEPGGTYPALGHALWIYGYGYAPDPEGAPKDRARQFDYLRARANGAGPTDRRRTQFRLLASAIGAQRERRDSDGGASLWPVLLDVLLAEETRATPWWIHYLTTTAVNFGVDPPKLYLTLEECSWPASIEAVAELRRGWRLTVEPTYQRDRDDLATLRSSVQEAVRGLLKTKLRQGKLRVEQPFPLAAVAGAAGAAGLGALGLVLALALRRKKEGEDR